MIELGGPIAAWLKALRGTTMLVGINYPWVDYGWDFGDPPAAWIAAESLPARREAKRKKIEEDFRLFAAQGIFAVRWFLLADGLSYGMGEYAPRRIGGGWAFDPLPAGHAFHTRLIDDFDFVLLVCRKYDLKLLPSLIDFHWCRQGMPAGDDPGIIKGGRYDIIRDPQKRQAFFDRVLEPLLASSMQYRGSIYAWEVINEPEWVVRGCPFFWKRDENRTVARKDMKEFIVEGIRRINSKLLPDGARAFQSSVGFAHWESMKKWDSAELGITLHQFHYYAQRDHELPKHARLTVHPGVVGEFATAAGRDWPDLKILNKDQTITNRLCCIEDRGYPACFMWSAKAMDPATRWTEEEHREVIAYNNSGGPKASARDVSSRYRLMLLFRWMRCQSRVHIS